MNFKQTSKCKIESIIFLWHDMDIFEFSKLLISIDHETIKIISSTEDNIMNILIELDFPMYKEFEVYIVMADCAFIDIQDHQDFVLLQNISASKLISKNKSHKIINKLKIPISELKSDQLNWDNFVFELDSKFWWSFWIKQTEDIEEIKCYNSIHFWDDTLIVNQNQIKEASYKQSYIEDVEEGEHDEEDIIEKEEAVIQVNSKYWNNSLIRIQITIDQISDSVFSKVVNDLNWAHSLKYLSFINIHIETALKFLREYKRFTFLKRLVLILKNNILICDQAELIAKKNEIEENGTTVVWFFMKEKKINQIFN